MKPLLLSSGQKLNWLTIVPAIILACLLTNCTKPHDPPVLSITPVASGFVAPIGLATDKYGRVWVAEMGSGKGDGRISVISNGTRYDAITSFESTFTPGGELEGPTHLLFHEGKLFILGAGGKLYKADVSHFSAGDTPLIASNLAVEDIGTFVLAYPFAVPTGETHPYNLVAAPDGSIYIADAAANAILKRSKSGVLSVVAQLPLVANPLPIGPPMIHPVPTGLIYEKGNLLVTTLTGFPFPAGKASIYKVSPNGNFAVSQAGFTTLVDIAKGNLHDNIAVQHAEFGPTGFVANSGKLIWVDGTTATDLAMGLNLPAGITQANAHTWYITSLADGAVSKVTY
ncbi:MAG: ScyD/ScyE family protein [Chitinophagaceae bacterium]